VKPVSPSNLAFVPEIPSKPYDGGELLSKAEFRSLAEGSSLAHQASLAQAHPRTACTLSMHGGLVHAL
jgi:hypothetical protein